MNLIKIKDGRRSYVPVNGVRGLSRGTGEKRGLIREGERESTGEVRRYEMV